MQSHGLFLLMYQQLVRTSESTAVSWHNGGLTGQTRTPATSAYRVCGNAILPHGRSPSDVEWGVGVRFPLRASHAHVRDAVPLVLA